MNLERMHTEDTSNGGTGGRLGEVTIILAGVAALAASIVTFVSVWLQLKNYRKPLLQRYVVRILFMVPIYSAASWASLVSLKAASWIDPLRDVYEAFTIYTFFQLLINFIGGERALIITMHGRPPKNHLWPLNHCLAKVDISDPYTFLAIKRGILQYTWIKPILAVATIVMKATDTYQPGYIGLGSGYFWSGLIYNISITVSLYALAMFWICMSEDLKPFRPMPKFLSIKGIIFASYWQGFFLSILSSLRLIPNDVEGYTRDNLAAAIQDALICFEMPLFAIVHWYAFSWKDYADVTISAARLPVKYALRDALGSRDLIEDAKETFGGGKYEYRQFDASDDVLAHEESRQRAARMKQGMRFERGGRGKYWIPKSGDADSKTPLLGESRDSSSDANDSTRFGYGSAAKDNDESLTLDEDDEGLFANARALEFGDWNYPVITAHHATREDRLYRNPQVITPSTNRNILQPTNENSKRRKGSIQKIQKSAKKGKGRAESGGSTSEESRPFLGRKDSRSSNVSSSSGESQRVDLVVEDREAEEVERIRARKDGDPHWNLVEPKHFVQTYSEDQPAEVVQEPIERAKASEAIDHDNVASSQPNDTEEARLWERRDYDVEAGSEEVSRRQETQEEEEDVSRNVWDSPKR